VKQLKRSLRSAVRNTPKRRPALSGYQEIVDGLIDEMTRLIRATESCKFSRAIKLVIIGNRGRVAFSGQVDENGKMVASGPQRQLKRSDFPANALVTDQSLSIRTFRIDCARS
jgi:hypothetical protein